jgi:hypothetical protein
MNQNPIESQYILDQIKINDNAISQSLTLRYTIATIVMSVIVALWTLILSGIIQSKTHSNLVFLLFLGIISSVIILTGWRYITHQVKSDDDAYLCSIICLEDQLYKKNNSNGSNNAIFVTTDSRIKEFEKRFGFVPQLNESENFKSIGELKKYTTTEEIKKIDNVLFYSFLILCLVSFVLIQFFFLWAVLLAVTAILAVIKINELKSYMELTDDDIAEIEKIIRKCQKPETEKNSE